MSRKTCDPDARARELLHLIGLARRCLQLRGATPDEQAYWLAEIGRASAELQAIHAPEPGARPAVVRAAEPEPLLATSDAA